MDITFVGGPESIDRYTLPVPIPDQAPLPEYICIGWTERDQHYLRSDEAALYRYAGLCLEFQHVPDDV
jgi:hypothetical protein